MTRLDGPADRGVACPRCPEQFTPPFGLNVAVTLADHYESDHPDIPFHQRARDIVDACR